MEVWKKTHFHGIIERPLRCADLKRSTQNATSSWSLFLFYKKGWCNNIWLPKPKGYMKLPTPFETCHAIIHPRPLFDDTPDKIMPCVFSGHFHFYYVLHTLPHICSICIHIKFGLWRKIAWEKICIICLVKVTKEAEKMFRIISIFSYAFYHPLFSIKFFPLFPTNTSSPTSFWLYHKNLHLIN